MSNLRKLKHPLRVDILVWVSIPKVQSVSAVLLTLQNVYIKDKLSYSRFSNDIFLYFFFKNVFKQLSSSCHVVMLVFSQSTNCAFVINMLVYILYFVGLHFVHLDFWWF